MTRLIAFLLTFGLVLLFSCSGSLFSKKEKPLKPYYFSIVTRNSAFHQPKVEKPLPAIIPKADSAISSSGSYNHGKDNLAVSLETKQNAEEVRKELSGEIKLNKKEESETSKGQKTTYHKVKAPDKKKTDNWFLCAAALFSVLTASVFRLFIPRAKNLASWAKENKKAARFSITAGHLLIGFGGYFIGRKLAEYGVATSDVSTYSLLGFAGLAALAYPDKNKNSWIKYTFRRNKILTLLVLLSGFFLFLNIGNREVTDRSFNPTTKQISEAAGSTLYADWQEEFRAEKKNENQPKDLGNVLLDILVIALALLIVSWLMAAITFISCMIACSGSPVIAAVVLLGGIVLCTFIMAWVIKGVSRRARKRKGRILPEDEEKPTGTEPIKEVKPEPKKEKPVPFKEKYKWF